MGRGVPERLVVGGDFGVDCPLWNSPVSAGPRADDPPATLDFTQLAFARDHDRLRAPCGLARNVAFRRRYLRRPSFRARPSLFCKSFSPAPALFTATDTGYP